MKLSSQVWQGKSKKVGIKSGNKIRKMQGNKRRQALSISCRQQFNFVCGNILPLINGWPRTEAFALPQPPFATPFALLAGGKLERKLSENAINFHK